MLKKLTLPFWKPRFYYIFSLTVLKVYLIFIYKIMKLKHLSLAFFSLCVLPLFSQESVTETVDQTATVAEKITIVDSEQKSDNAPFSHLSVGIRASTVGGGIEVATPLNDRFVLRGGLSYFNLKTGQTTIDLEDTDDHVFEQAFGYTPDYKMKGDLKFVNGHVLVDLYPTKGVFHVTAGVFLGTNKISAKGFLANPNTGEEAHLKNGVSEWPNIDFDGHQLTMKDANLNADLQLGKAIKPYLGIGIGRAIANKRVAFKFELGAIYQGKYSLKQNGKEVQVVNNGNENFEDIDTYTQWLKWWPMLNFQLTYKIF